MNQREAKKIRQYARRYWKDFIKIFWEDVAELPLTKRLVLAWRVVWARRTRKKRKTKPPRYIRKALRAMERQKKQRMATAGSSGLPYPHKETGKEKAGEPLPPAPEPDGQKQTD